MLGLKRWIQCCPGIKSPLALVIHSPLEMHALFGVALMALHHPCSEVGQTVRQSMMVFVEQLSLVEADGISSTRKSLMTTTQKYGFSIVPCAAFQKN